MRRKRLAALKVRNRCDAAIYGEKEGKKEEVEVFLTHGAATGGVAYQMGENFTAVYN